VEVNDGQAKGVIPFQSEVCSEVKAPPSSSDFRNGQRRERGPSHDTVYLAFRRAVQPRKPIGPRRARNSFHVAARFACKDSIVGHGRRRKQAHDEHHDWIGIRRGVCNRCGKTFTFLPPFSPPYGHYSLIARSQALHRYFVEGCGWESEIMLTQAVKSYIVVHRATGFAFRSEGSLLQSFAAFSDAAGKLYVSSETAIEWAGSALSLCQRARRLGQVIRFAR
jgi:hypothetical protein